MDMNGETGNIINKTTVMSKQTPIQEAISLIENDIDGDVYDRQIRAADYVREKAIEYLKSLLPKEKEFARDMFTKGLKRSSHINTKYPDAFNFLVSEKANPSFDDHYKQYEP